LKDRAVRMVAEIRLFAIEGVDGGGASLPG
jgi:hypothetical protein